MTGSLVEPEHTGVPLPVSSSAEPPPARLATSASPTCSRMALLTYLAMLSEGRTITMLTAVLKGALPASKVLCFLSPQFPWWLPCPHTHTPRDSPHVPFESSVGLGFNCPGDTFPSGNLIFVDLCFALKAWRSVSPTPLPTGMQPAGRRLWSVLWTAWEPGDRCWPWLRVARKAGLSWLLRSIQLSLFFSRTAQ